MPATTFQAVTDRGRFVRKSQSHNAAKPFTHVVLVELRDYDYSVDGRVSYAATSTWYCNAWAGSLAGAEKAAKDARKHQGERLVSIEIVAAVIVEKGGAL